MQTQKITRLLKHSRPRFWLYLLGPVLIAGASIGPKAFMNPLFWIFFIYTTFPANIYLYGVNDLADRDTDKYNKKKEGKETRAKAQDTVLKTAVGISLLLSLTVILLLPPIPATILLGYVFLATFYSLPPIRFKAIPFLDSISNILYILPGISLYVALSQTYPSVYVVLSGWAWTAAMHLFSAIPDIEPDKKAGLSTTATTLKEKNSLILCTALWTTTTVLILQENLFLGTISIIYPVLSLIPLLTKIPVEKQYWWYPYINGVGGFILFWILLLPTLL